MTITHPEISRTCEAPAVLEVHGLHAFGEHDLVDGTCRRDEGKERKKDKVRNEEACAAADRENV